MSADGPRPGVLALRPNVGAEEPGGETQPAAREAARLWRLLFPEDAVWPDTEPPCWPERWPAAARSGPAFAWLPDTGLCAWWNDAASADAARDAGLALAGPAPDAVARVHDKAFAARIAAAERLLPRALRGRVVVFEPHELSDPAAFCERLRTTLADWPDALARSATLKPRFGTSGRGRVRVEAPEADDWRGALPRLAERGGALLEPWLERTADYSVELHVARDGAITLLGTLEQLTTPSGGYRGHRGEIDHRGRVGSGAAVDDALLEAALALARVAHAEGYYGPCGVDAFAFRDGDRTALHPAVELNARFTMGTVVLGLLHRARIASEAAGLPEPGRRRRFAFSFDAGTPTGVPRATAAAFPLARGSATLEFQIS